MTVATPDDGAVVELDAAHLVEGVVPTAGVQLEHHSLFAKPSASISLKNVQQIADRIESAFDGGLDGAVITHGTDTMEETAFALALLLSRTQPVVITGAMRSASEVGADGPANIAAALAVACCAQAGGQGPLVLFGGEIHAAHLVRKVHSSRVHAFSSDPFGAVGHVTEGKVSFELQSRFAPGRLRVGECVPAVPIIQTGLDLEPETIAAFEHAPVGGLIIAGVGGGHVSSRAADAIGRLAVRIPVVLTSRVGMGGTLRSSYAYAGSEIDLARRGVINGGRWRPNQARIIIQIALSNGATPTQAAEALTIA